MSSLQPPTFHRIAAVHHKQLQLFNSVTVNTYSAVFNNGRISRCATKCASGGGVRVRTRPYNGHFRKIRCQFSSPSFGDHFSGNSDPGDGDFVNSTVLEAVEVKNGSDGFVIKMRDGRYLRCVCNHLKGGYPPDYISHPAIVLKMEDGSGLLLPIIVLEMPSALLMAALHNVKMARPTAYEIVKEMIEAMGYMVRFVRITKRVHEAYYAELYVAKVNDETSSHSFDLRPSDAINIAIRCKAPILVNKQLAHKDGLKIVESVNPLLKAPVSGGSLLSEMDRPDGQPCPESEEFVILRNMLIAAIEERYHDAAQWKNVLTQFRSRRQKWT